AMSTRRSAKVSADLPIPSPTSLERHVRAVPQLGEVWSYLNLLMLFGHHLGFKGKFEKALAQRDPKALEMAALVEELKVEAAQVLHVRAVWQFFPAEPDGNAIHLFAAGAGPGAAPLHTFQFERQRKENGLCLADYVLPPRAGVRDHIALLVVTAGAGVRERAEAARQAGRYVYSHGLQVLALETAEATAEWLHRRIREDWGFPDPPGMAMKDRHTSRYRGKRYAFGYPACPNLNDQAGIWKLLRPEEIGVELTDGMMMEPEASTSALVFHHPACAYFSVSDEAAGRAVSHED
ncbi:MAG: vitamin B12 dependent-methionine synthase activation domain-containing protein, partial [Terriglobales bacterium]